LAVKILNADFAAASRNDRKNFCCSLEIDITLVIDVNKNEHLVSGCAVYNNHIRRHFLGVDPQAPRVEGGRDMLWPGRMWILPWH